MLEAGDSSGRWLGGNFWFPSLPAVSGRNPKKVSWWLEPPPCLSGGALGVTGAVPVLRLDLQNLSVSVLAMSEHGGCQDWLTRAVLG